LGFLYLNINGEQWRIIPNNILNINPFWGFFIQTFVVNNNKLFLIIFWILTHLGFLYPNITNE